MTQWTGDRVRCIRDRTRSPGRILLDPAFHPCRLYCKTGILPILTQYFNRDNKCTCKLQTWLSKIDYAGDLPSKWQLGRLFVWEKCALDRCRQHPSNVSIRTHTYPCVHTPVYVYVWRHKHTTEETFRAHERKSDRPATKQNSIQ